MGVPAFWDLIKTQESLRRLPLKQFVVEFKSNFHRPLRLAIDAFTWLFESGFIGSETERPSDKGYRTDAQPTLTLLNRLKCLLSLDITFVLVFDGPMKPSFKNKFKTKTSNNDCCELTFNDEEYISIYKEHRKQHEIYGACSSSLASEEIGGLAFVKRLLKTMNISFIDTCGEGEAECARLQREGLVDYVLSNDSDTLVFGATRVLRNFSRFWEDLPATYTGALKRKDHKEMFVTVVDMQHIRNWNRSSLVLYCTLLGADYNQGIRGLGSKKAAKLAQLTTPNFAETFKNIFEDYSQRSDIRRKRYLKFQGALFEYCCVHSKELFGRNYFSSKSASFQGWPSDIAIMHYFHPVLSPHVNRKSLSEHYVNVSGNSNFTIDNTTKLMNLLEGLKFNGITDFKKWFHDMVHSTFLLKEILYGNRTHQDLAQLVKITEEWCAGVCQNKYRVPCWRIRYNTFLLAENKPSPQETAPKDNDFVAGHSEPHKRSGSPSKKQMEKASYKFMTSIPKDLIPEDNILVTNYHLEHRAVSENDRRPKRGSPRKIASQKSNLDGFLKKYGTPRKHGSPQALRENLEPESEIIMNPKRKLFVEEDLDDSDPGNSSSLILVSERDCSSNGLHTSPKRALDLFVATSEDEDLSASVESEESPLKKIKSGTGTAKLQLPTPRKLLPDNFVDLTFEGG
ncbi:LAQU0S14e02432g1_1 [Lachancea quebecensis]|uniref:LAQU0S14e02432g1_1 n=1 Tax=Lachancea quebecensis TaxID=1654605 RepID=A0A0P1KVL4_9SACH|nr:LAQU0S14e02432g1_1 [Lachancea quebecensis]